MSLSLNTKVIKFFTYLLVALKLLTIKDLMTSKIDYVKEGRVRGGNFSKDISIQPLVKSKLRISRIVSLFEPI